MRRLTMFLRAVLVAALMALGVVTGGSVAAQDATEVVEETTAQVDEVTEDDDDGFDWGLLGLLGLAGLAGLLRRPQPVVHETERTGYTGTRTTDRDDSTL